LPSVEDKGLDNDEFKSIQRNVVLHCGTNSIDWMQNYARLDKEILGEECNKVAKHAVQIFYNNTSYNGSKSYTHQGQWLYLCNKHYEAFQKNGLGNTSDTIRFVFREGEVVINGLDVGFNHNEIHVPTRLHAVESLHNWTPKIDIVGFICVDVPDPREVHMPPQYFENISGRVTNAYMPGLPKEFFQEGKVIKYTLPDNFVPPMSKECRINMEVQELRQRLSHGGD
jgi:hypothetical protein